MKRLCVLMFAVAVAFLAPSLDVDFSHSLASAPPGMTIDGYELAVVVSDTAAQGVVLSYQAADSLAFCSIPSLAVEGRIVANKPEYTIDMPVAGDLYSFANHTTSAADKRSDAWGVISLAVSSNPHADGIDNEQTSKAISQWVPRMLLPIYTC